MWYWHDWGEDGHAVNRPAAATAVNDASPKPDPAWNRYRPGSSKTPTSESKPGSSNIAQIKRISNQQCADQNVGRPGCYRLISASSNAGHIDDFDYEAWLESQDCWNHEIYMEGQAKRKEVAKQAAKSGVQPSAKKKKRKGKGKGNEDEPQLTLAMSREYFNQVLLGFNTAVERLRRNQGIYTDYPTGDYRVELKGAHHIGKMLEKVECCRSIVQVLPLPHGTADEDSHTCPPPMERTDLEHLDREAVKLVMQECAQVEVDPDEAIDHASDEFQNLPSTFAEALDQARTGNKLSPAAVTAAGQKLEPVTAVGQKLEPEDDKWKWQTVCIETANEHYLNGLDKDAYFEQCSVMTEAMEENRKFSGAL